MLRQLLFMLLAFAIGSAVAGILGAANLGVALSVGAICLLATLVFLVLRE